MKITPLDIQKKRFPAKFRGVDKEDVHSFLELVREEMEKLLRENASLREEVQSTEKQLQDYKDMESAIRNMLIATQQMAEGYKNNAQKEAEVIKKEAELQTHKIGEAQKKVIKIHGDITDLKRIRRHFKEDVRLLIESHLKMLDFHEDVETEHKAEVNIYRCYP